MYNGIILKTILICVYIAAASFLFAAENIYIADIHAVSNGKEKTIYARINKQKTENKISLVISEHDSGDIEIRSEKFKLGKMPFSSSFHFILPKTSAGTNGPDMLSITSLSGTYKVAGSKESARLSGILSRSAVDLYLETSGMGKKLVLHITYSE